MIYLVDAHLCPSEFVFPPQCWGEPPCSYSWPWSECAYVLPLDILNSVLMLCKGCATALHCSWKCRSICICNTMRWRWNLHCKCRSMTRTILSRTHLFTMLLDQASNGRRCMCYNPTFSFSFSFLEYTFHDAQQAAHRLLFDIRPTHACSWYLPSHRTIALLLPHEYTHYRLLFVTI